MLIRFVLLFCLVNIISYLQANPLQELIDATPKGGILIPPPGIYYGSVTLEKPITLDGQGKVTIDAVGKGTVILLDTDSTTIQNLSLVNSGGSHNSLDSGIQVRGDFNIIKDNIIENCLFGIDLGQANNNIIKRNAISSKDNELGMRGDSIRLWYSVDNQVTDNKISKTRDMVVWYSKDNLIARNVSVGGRYALHFMYSKTNTVDANHYTHSSVGIFLMYSDGVVITNNYIANSQGTTGMGIGLKESSNVVIKGNKILYNSTGIYSDVSPYEPDTTNLMENNLVAFNSIGVLFHNDWTGNIARNNSFKDNMNQVVVLGGGSANRNIWQGNYWDDYVGFDTNQDGFGDTAYQTYDYADRLWMDVPNAQFFKATPILEFLDLLERLAPFSEPVLLVEDKTPLFDNPISR